MDRTAERIRLLPRYLFAEIDKNKGSPGEGIDVIKLGIGSGFTYSGYIIKRMQEEVARPSNHTYPPDEGVKSSGSGGSLLPAPPWR